MTTEPCPHQLSGLLCRLSEIIHQNKDGERIKNLGICKVEMGEKCPFGKDKP